MIGSRARGVPARGRIPVYLGLGSNLGDRQQNLDRAGNLLLKTPGVSSGRFSGVYYTEPQGVKEQPWFANQVAEVYCPATWSAIAFVHRLLQIEDILGRKRDIRWGPRVIDLDLLLWGDLRLQSAEATIPHPRMTERAFVLIPLLEIRSDIRLPGGRPLKEHLRTLNYDLDGADIRQA
ncbi:MAG: 2-amino-4-hydroxy-6-hydroxymethyldihydropteridine diphosphokinase [Desulfohalobiaceae bacterium]|nr:2-amino-4-hydroxy-6-hydroxymethyldihydropteridine diphosphokinase [Desulfohalobiaceae bacterium]